jgi:2-polyprenyl-3-methyl-5-hydroxy-6-metoxy-1,4-benzoquinol methylase
MTYLKKIIKNFVPNQIMFFMKKYVFVKPGKKMFKKIFDVATFFIRNKIYRKKLAAMEKNENLINKDLFATFKEIKDEFWFWLFTKGYSESSSLQNILPSMPNESIQLQFTGKSGEETLEEAFAYYDFIKQTAKKWGVSFQQNCKVLDFGCGWGRIIRYFLKDVYAENLFGIDCDESIIIVCQSSNLNCNFNVNTIFPPTEFKDNFFDIIYSFSVFSHLSEDAHIKWLMEFKRILKPDGILIVTTRSREFILSCAKMQNTPENDIPFFAKGLTKTFVNTNKSLVDYDEGKYVYEPVGGGGIRDGSFYGETCIPKKYVENEWIKYFNKVDFISQKKHNLFNQCAILAKK